MTIDDKMSLIADLHRYKIYRDTSMSWYIRCPDSFVYARIKQNPFKITYGIECTELSEYMLEEAMDNFKSLQEDIERLKQLLEELNNG